MLMLGAHQSRCIHARSVADVACKLGGIELQGTAGAALLQGCSRPPMHTHKCGDPVMATAFAAKTACITTLHSSLCNITSQSLSAICRWCQRRAAAHLVNTSCLKGFPCIPWTASE